MYLVLGSTGYVGKFFLKYISSIGEDIRGLSRVDFDYSDEKKLISFLEKEQPKFLINAAGYTGKPNVDACELNKQECLFGNSVLPGRIRTACEKVGIPWGMFLADVFIQVKNLMVKVGVRTILRIFLFVMDHAVFTVVQKHSEKKF